MLYEKSSAYLILTDKPLPFQKLDWVIETSSTELFVTAED